MKRTRLLSMGFEREVTEIISALPEKKQSFLCSATVDDHVKRLAGNFSSQPEIIDVSSDSIGAASVDHVVYNVPVGTKLDALRRLLGTHDESGAIIFANTRAATFRVAEAMEADGYRVVLLNGELSQAERERALKKMKGDHIDYLVATDVAARGIDISGLPAVVNYDMPGSARGVHSPYRTYRSGRPVWSRLLARYTG